MIKLFGEKDIVCCKTIYSVDTCVGLYGMVCLIFGPMLVLEHTSNCQ